MKKQIELYVNYTVINNLNGMNKTKIIGSGIYYIKIRKGKDEDLQKFNNFISDLERLVEDKLK